MSATFRTRKSRFILSAAAVLVLVAIARLFGPSTSVSAQDNRAESQLPGVNTQQDPQDEGNADKKEGPSGSLDRFMRQKLQASTMILEGLCTEDLAMVNKGADTLLKMSKEEKWRVSNDMMYRRYSTEFGHAVEELQKEATDNDMDGTSMAWVNVTMKCLKCHEWVRGTILAESPLK